MSTHPPHRHGPPGTVYGGGAPAQPRGRALPIAAAVGVVGVLAGIGMAFGACGGGGSPATTPAAVASAPDATEPVTTKAPATKPPATTTPPPTTTTPPPPEGQLLRSASSGLCLAPAQPGQDGGPVVQVACGDGKEQRWRVTPVGGDVATLYNVADGL